MSFARILIRSFCVAFAFAPLLGPKPRRLRCIGLHPRVPVMGTPMHGSKQDYRTRSMYRARDGPFNSTFQKVLFLLYTLSEKLFLQSPLVYQ